MHFTSVINRNWYPYANPENFVSNPVTTVIYAIGKNTVDYDIFRSFLRQSRSLKKLRPILAEIVLAL